MIQGFESKPAKGDEAYFVYALLDPKGNAEEWRVAHKGEEDHPLGYIVEEVVFAPTRTTISESSTSECLPFYILKGIPKGLVINHEDIFISLEQAQFECEIRSIFPQ